MNTNRILIIFSVLITFNACSNENEPGQEEDLLVLEAYLYNGMPIENISLSKTISFTSADTIFPRISEAFISICWNNQTYPLIPSEKEGFYHNPDTNLKIITGETYQIEALYADKVLSAQTIVPQPSGELNLSTNTLYIDPNLTPREMMQNGIGTIEITWDNPSNDYFFLAIENLETNPETIDLGFDGGGKSFTFRSQPFNTEAFSARLFMAIKQYGTHRVRLFRVNQEYVDLYTNLEQDSRDLNEPLTNVENGLGIFTAFGDYEEAFFEVYKQ